MTAPTASTRLIDGRSLIPPALFDRLSARIAAEHPELTADMPARVLDQALAFLGTCATATEPIGPSETVDIGWHTFILYTREYSAFCDRIAGRFIHHEPDGAPGEEWPTIPKASGVPVSAAVAAVRAAGYRLDPDLWGVKLSGKTGTDCTQCHAGCTDSPTR